MSRTCAFTGKRPNTANKVSHSNHKTKRRQLPNLQVRKMWWTEGNTFITVKLSTRALRSIDKVGLQVFADKMGLKLADFVS